MDRLVFGQGKAGRGWSWELYVSEAKESIDRTILLQRRNRVVLKWGRGHTRKGATRTEAQVPKG